MGGRGTALLVIVVGVVGCGGGAPGPAAEPEETLPMEEQAPASPAATLPSVDVCALVPGTAVENLLGGTISDEPHRSDSGEYQGCDYSLTPADGGFEFVAIWIQPAATIRDPESVLETARGLGQEASAETLDGLGDRAFVVENASEEQATVYVVRGETGVEVTAGTAERARLLAEHVLEQAP